MASDPKGGRSVSQGVPTSVKMQAQTVLPLSDDQHLPIKRVQRPLLELAFPQKLITQRNTNLHLLFYYKGLTWGIKRCKKSKYEKTLPMRSLGTVSKIL